MDQERRGRPYHPGYDNPLGPMMDPAGDDHPQGPSSEYDPDANYLGRLASQDEGQAEDTDAALKQLFASHSDLSGSHEYSNELQIDPTLANPDPNGSIQANEQEEQGQVQVQVDVPLPADSAESETASPGPVKRKATSRANMLSRGGACEFCKRRKLKCTAELPACAACIRAGKECVYSQKKQRSRVRVLEDRLMELERKLEKGDTGANGTAGAASGSVPSADPSTVNSLSGPVTWISPLTSVESPSHALDLGRDNLGGFANVPSDLGFTLPGFELQFVLDKRAEPDLMTLADAAAADVRTVRETYEWENMTTDQIAGEIIKGIEGAKGVGEKIIVHLLQFYFNPPGIPKLSAVVNPPALKARLTLGSTSPPHASLILSLLPFLFPLSPSRSLSDPSRSTALSTLLLAPARALASHAYAAADPRLLDVITGNAIRSFYQYMRGRYLDGWAEASGGAAMAWAAGLGKLGGVGEGLVGGNSPVREERIARERRLREIRSKSTVVEPPRTPAELGQRIELFWQIYICDKAGAIGWGWPSTFDDEEVTTPWPKSDYDNPDVLRDNRSVGDLFSMRTPQGREDNDYCVFAKSLTLLYRATRLFDLPAKIATPERTSHFLRVTKMYMSAIRTVLRDPSGESAVSSGLLNQSWMKLHTTMMLLHAKEELDAPPGGEAEHFEKAVEAMGKVVEHIELAYTNGDQALEGFDIIAAMVWQIVARTAYRYAERLEREEASAGSRSGSSGKVGELRRIAEVVLDAIRTLGKRFGFAKVTAQVCENLRLGYEFKVGEWERPDNV